MKVDSFLAFSSMNWKVQLSALERHQTFHRATLTTAA